jgi:hypothetical protein
MFTSRGDLMLHSRVDEAPHGVQAVREKFDTVRESFVQLVLVEDFLSSIEPKRRGVEVEALPPDELEVHVE